MILLDTGSSIGATFMNPDLVTNIKVAKQPIQMPDIKYLDWKLQFLDLERFTMIQK